MENTKNGVMQRGLTFGEKAVGLTFNPGNNKKVDAIKKSFSSAIDLLNDEREALKGNDEKTGESHEKIRMLSIAITELQTAQMWAVKAITWE